MYQTLILLGIVCVLAAVVGGGLKAFGIEVPKLAGARIAIVLIIGVVLVGSGIAVRPKPPPPGPTGIFISTDPLGPLTAASCPVNVKITGYITTTGGYGNVTVRLELNSSTRGLVYSPPLTLSFQGAGKHTLFDTWLFR